MAYAAHTDVDPRLESALAALDQTGWAIEAADAEWRFCWSSEEMRFLLDDAIAAGQPFAATRRARADRGLVDESSQVSWLERHIPYILHDTGDAAALKQQIGPQWAPLIDSLAPAEPPLTWSAEIVWTPPGARPMKVRYLAQRLHTADGELLGTAFMYGAAMRARLLAYVARGSEPMFERMVRLTAPSRREAAILFADLQASGQLSRRLPSAAYFTLLRELNAAIDDVVIEASGIVGKHAGDGVTAFFLADDAGSTSGAARAALGAAFSMCNAAERVARCAAAESQGTVTPDDVRLNIGVHWGGTLYMGQVVTSGRLEVTALGDEVNECARMQETARDGGLLASKALIERLTPEDAAALGVEPERTLYSPLANLSGAGDKAIRDAGGLAVCRVRPPAG